MKNLYLLIEMREGLIESVVAYDKRSDANRKFRARKKELRGDPDSYFMKVIWDAIAFYRIDPQLNVQRIDYFDEGME